MTVQRYILYKPDGEIVGEMTNDAVSAQLTAESNNLLLLATDATLEDHYVENGQPVQKPARPPNATKFNLQTKQWELDTAQKWREVRRMRGEKLKAADWTQFSDVPLSGQQRQAWTAYRQALRDITDQPDPFNIVWPVAPG
jgi:hypothetical protein